MVIFTTIMGVFRKITLETFPMVFVFFLEVIIGKVSKVFMGTEAKCLWGRRLSTGTEAFHGDGEAFTQEKAHTITMCLGGQILNFY